MKSMAAEGNKTGKPLWSMIVLGLIFLFALGMRIYPVIKHPENIRFGIGQFDDAYLYNEIAVNLYKFKSFSCAVKTSDNGHERQWLEPVIYRGPGYPFFMYLVYTFLGSKKDIESPAAWHKNWDKVRMVQCSLDSVICLIIYFIVRCIYPGSPWPALISACLYVFSFYNIFYTRALLSESLATFLLSLSLLAYIRALTQNSKSWLIAAGAGCGLTILTRPEYVLLPFVFALYIFLINRHAVIMAIQRSTLFIVSAIIVIAPWTMRNYMVFKEPIVVSTGQLGYSLFVGTFEGNQQWHGWPALPEEILADSAQKEKFVTLYNLFQTTAFTGSIRIKEFDKYFMNLALRRIREHVFLCLQSWLKNTPRLWYQNYVRMYAGKEASGVFFLFYFSFALYAFLRSQRKERILIAPVFLIFIYLSAIFLPLHTEPRYGVALMPAIICIAGIGLWKLLRVMVNNFLRFQ
jgi:4-amino-4-deoxy-L-arabinose transferase-like glycosyltransferase